MKRALQRNFSLYTRNIFSSTTLKKSNTYNPLSSLPILPLTLTCSELTSCFSTSNKNPNSLSNASSSIQPQINTDVEDVSNEELKKLIETYDKGDENAIPSIFEAILKRKLVKKHEESDDELMEELRNSNKSPKDFSEIESDFEEMCSTDQEVDDLPSAGKIVVKRMVNDE